MRSRPFTLWLGWLAGIAMLCGLSFHAGREASPPAPLPAPGAAVSPPEPDPQLAWEQELLAEAGAVPHVEGEITAVKASPDGSRAAVIVRRGVSYRLCLLDLGTGALLAQHPMGSDGWLTSLSWSLDSRWVAVPRAEVAMILADRHGRVRTVQLPRPVYELQWVPDRPDRIAYLGGSIYEFDLRARRETELLTGRDVTSLFINEGRLCYGYCDPPRGSGSWRGKPARACAATVEGHTTFLRVLLRGEDSEMWNDLHLSVSPDRRYFFLRGAIDAGGYNLLARTADAGQVLQQMYRAIYYETGTERFYQVDWLQPDSKSPQAAVEDDGMLVEQVDLKTGSRGYDYNDFRQLERLPDGSQLCGLRSGLVLYSVKPPRLILVTRPRKGG